MLKIYLISCLIWFIILMAQALLFHREFIKARDKFRKETNTNSKIDGYFKTTFTYLLASFIPVYRLFLCLGKFIFVFNPDKFIENYKVQKESEENK